MESQAGTDREAAFFLIFMSCFDESYAALMQAIAFPPFEKASARARVDSSDGVIVVV